MESVFLILGNQLFPISYLKKFRPQHILMAEDHGLCTHYKYHKHKIILFLSAMRNYRDELKKDFKVTYFDLESEFFKKTFEKKIEHFLKTNKKIKVLECFEIEDKFFEKRVEEFARKKNLELKVHKGPLFLVNRTAFKEYLKDNKRPFLKTFYEGQRKYFNIMVDSQRKPVGGKWSFDSENRKKLGKGIQPPSIPLAKLDANTQKVMSLVESHFRDHPGVSDNFWLPTTRRETLKWLRIFIKDRLVHFGDYQDSITSKSDFVYHSVLSPMLNMGLILPREVVQAAEKAYRESPKKYPLNSVEGLIRQVLGWREFVRGIYQNYSEDQWEKNFWNNQRKMNSSWYQGDTGIPILDDAINKAQEYSYNHHIERLMILSNLMLLCEIHPHEVYKWFMEMYADSSDWVMGPNVFGMGQFSDGGIFATKPYICGSNYYKKMSDYKVGPWCDIVDGLYWRFVEKNFNFFSKNPRLTMMVGHLKKMDGERKKLIFKEAEKFIKKVTL